MNRRFLIIGAVCILLSCNKVTWTRQKTSDERAERVVPPEIVECTNTHILPDIKTATVTNEKKCYELSCNAKAGGCATLIVGKKYFLYDKNTRWKLHGAKDFTTLAWFQDWAVTYSHGENVALVSQDTDSGGFGVYILDSFIDVSAKEGTLRMRPKASLALQEKCAGGSKKVFDQWLQGTLEYRKPGISTSFSDHYDPESNGCFMETVVTPVPMGNEFSTIKFVSDAYEGSVLANYVWISKPDKKYWEVSPMECMVKGRDGKENHCSSDEEFQQMVRVLYGVVE